MCLLCDVQVPTRRLFALLRIASTIAFVSMAAALGVGCGERETRVHYGDLHQILHRGNGTEPQDIDPQTVTGVPEDHIIVALFEGLVAEDPHDLHPIPGVAESWDISEDQKTYTFHFRKMQNGPMDSRWLRKILARSYKRMLTPTLAAEYAYMLYVMKNAKPTTPTGSRIFRKWG